MLAVRLFVVLGVLLPLASWESKGPEHALPPPTGMPSEAWLGSVGRTTAASEYTFATAGSGSFSAPNRGQNLRVTADPAGWEVVPRQFADSVRFRLELSGVGRGQTAAASREGRIAVAGGRLELVRGDVTEWIVNTPSGIEHGVTLRERPAGGDDEAFVSFRLAGNVQAFADGPRGGSILLRDSTGRPALRYGDLLVVDADGRGLGARIDPRAGELRITWRDAGAKYPVTIDPLVTNAIWTWSPDQANATVSAVACAGDVNGDGYSDLLVGSPDYDHGSTNEGKVWAFYGSPSGLPATPAWSVEWDGAGAELGGAIASAGDVNGDGFDDVILGAWKWSRAGLSNRGMVRLYYGGPTGLATTHAWSREGTSANANLGQAVAAAGDVNGDGFDDVAVAAPGYLGASPLGAVEVFLGAASGLAASPQWFATGTSAGDRFGESIASAGDVDGDGFDELLVGSLNHSEGEAGEGKAYLFRGGPGGLTSGATWSAQGDQAGARFGVVAPAGDINGDGYADIAIGAPGYDNGPMVDAGKVFAWLGSAAGLPAQPSWSFSRYVTGEEVGSSVFTIGDENADGFADLAVGAPRRSDGQEAEGVVLVFEGSRSGLREVYPPLQLDQAGAELGRLVASAGDVNGDGFSELVAVAPLWDGSFVDSSAAFVFAGSGTLYPHEYPLYATRSYYDVDFGYAVAGAGDVNGDGFDDVLVSAANWINDEPRVFLFGGASAGPDATWEWSKDNFATAIGLGDINGDGFDDVLGIRVDSDWRFSYQPPGGRPVLFRGTGTGLSLSPAWFADVTLGVDALARTGDVNGDGFADLVLPSDDGVLRYFPGSPRGLDPVPDVEYRDPARPGFARRAAGAGDVNRDGRDDVLVWTDTDLRLYLGTNHGLATTPAWSWPLATSATAGAAGDVNGDGFADVIVGEPHYVGPNGESGRGLAFHGGPDGLPASPSWTYAFPDDGGWPPLGEFGRSLTAAGDADGDGFGDVVFGVDGKREGGDPLYVFLGSASGLGPTFARELGAGADCFTNETRIALAGDVDGDGFDDLLFGDREHGGNCEGIARVFGAGGATRLPRQLRPGFVGRIPVNGIGPSSTSFDLSMLGRTPGGRGNVRIEPEARPLDTAFTSWQSGPWVATSAPGPDGSYATLFMREAYLTPRTPYHWRVRTATDWRYAPRSRWFTVAGRGPTQRALLTADADIAAMDDGDGTLDPCTGGGVTDECDDNCPSVENGQRDGDGDGRGDACDPPNVAYVTPGDNSRGVPLYAGVQVTFSEPVDRTSIEDLDGDGSPGGLVLTAGGVPLPGRVGLSSDGFHATFDPSAPLAPDTVYVVEVRLAVRDDAGAPALPFSSLFVTTPGAGASQKELADAEGSAGDADGERRGTSIASAGDVDGDGIEDWLVGAPGWAGSGVRRGRVLLYLGVAEQDGTADDLERESPDVVFTGSRDDGNLGVSVAGGVDVDRDGRPDLLFGADDGSDLAAPGRAYLVHFDPTDYPHLGDPGLVDEVSIDAVADVVFTGADAGDLAGHSVALTMDATGDGTADLLIGAPLADRAGIADRGEAYLARGGPWPAAVSLARIGSLDAGITYVGSSAGDHLGWSVAAGDWNGDGRPDVVLGAPGLDTVHGGDSGAVYADIEPVDQQDGMDIDSVGRTPGGPHDGVSLIGDSPGSRFGWSVGVSDDSDGDGFDEILGGAPGATVGSNADVGEVGYLAGRPLGLTDPRSLSLASLRQPTSVEGAVFLGAYAGDQLGFAVGSAGDVDADGLADLSFGAPGLDPSAGRAEAGGVYLVHGQPGPGLVRGSIPVTEIGQQRPGAVYVGEAMGDAAGSAVSRAGRVTGGVADAMGVGAPHHAAGGVNDAGKAYLVIEPPRQDTTLCTPADGCTIVDLRTGARFALPPGALQAAQQVLLTGVVAAEEIPLSPPGGFMFAGAVDVEPGALAPAVAALLDVPLRDDLQGQFHAGEAIALFWLQHGEWTQAGTAVIGANPLFAGSLAAEATVSRGGWYAVLAPDGDGDGLRDGLDPDLDGDGIANALDVCPGEANPSQADTNADGTPDACEDVRVVRVPGDYATIQAAVDSVTRPGTCIEIAASPGGMPYTESVQIDRRMPLCLRAHPDHASGIEAVIESRTGSAIRVWSTSGAQPITLAGVTLSGFIGVRSGVAVTATDVRFRDVVGVAYQALGGDHIARGIDMTASTKDGIEVEADASLDLRRSKLRSLGGASLVVRGRATLENTLITDCATGVVVENGGVLAIQSSTIAQNRTPGVEVRYGEVESIDASIVWGNLGPADLVGVTCDRVTWSGLGPSPCIGVNGNRGDDPVFDDDYNLSSTSALIDSGRPLASYTGSPCFDLSGGPRVRDGNADGRVARDPGALERRWNSPYGAHAEPTGVRWLDRDTLTCDGGATHVHRGMLSGFSYGMAWPCRDDLTWLGGDRLYDPEIPPSGAGFYYIVSYDNDVWGPDPPPIGESTLGFGTCAERDNPTPCPPR